MKSLIHEFVVWSISSIYDHSGSSRSKIGGTIFARDAEDVFSSVLEAFLIAQAWCVWINRIWKLPSATLPATTAYDRSWSCFMLRPLRPAPAVILASPIVGFTASLQLFRGLLTGRPEGTLFV
ncbi:unnamed protein product [Durusdinium trenchii]|uniref:Uncharacterized protein n=1 Tax=Durusdinium trenchii TaxID=1381693 RepID=A0ABP0MQN1_9DINO